MADENSVQAAAPADGSLKYRKWFKAAVDNGREWRKKAVEDYEFYHGLQCAGADGGTYTPGTNGIGTGNYAPGATGGEDKHQLTVAELASHLHYSGWDGQTAQGPGAGNYKKWDINTAPTTSTGGDQAHENRPPYYALCFLYKI